MFGLVGGDIMHGTMSHDQLWSARPLLGNGSYRGPVRGLYMCGAGTHLGGGVTGAPGHNAAQVILRDRGPFAPRLRYTARPPEGSARRPAIRIRAREIGRATGRARVCKCVYISVVSGTIKTYKSITPSNKTHRT